MLRRPVLATAAVMFGLLGVACEGQPDLIGMANGTERPLAIVEVYSHTDIDGGLQEPGDVFFFDMVQGYAGPMEIRDERGVLLSRIDLVAYCRENPVFTVTDDLLDVERWAKIDNCQEDVDFEMPDFVRTDPVVVDPHGLILQARWRDPDADHGEPRIVLVGEPGAVLAENSEPTALRIVVNGRGCVPQSKVIVESGPPSLELKIELGPGIVTGRCHGSFLRTHAMEVVLAQPVDLDSISLTATGLTFVERAQSSSG